MGYENTLIKRNYDYLLSIGFKDITGDVVNQLKQSKFKSYTSVLERINESSYYYILERNNEVGLLSTWYATKPEIQIISKITGKTTAYIRAFLSNEEDIKYCNIANNRIEENVNMENDELQELNNIICEIRRCVSLFYDETETFLDVEEYNDDFMIVKDTETNNKYMIKVTKMK